MTFRAILTGILICFVVACAVAPEEINYHADACAYCRMQISDARFGAELVTRKGKVYKYDSSECLFHALSENNPDEYQYILVTDYTIPGELIDARSARFLVSPGRQSPMGGNLSAYAVESTAQAVQAEVGGELFDFNEMLEHASR